MFTSLLALAEELFELLIAHKDRLFCRFLSNYSVRISIFLNLGLDLLKSSSTELFLSTHLLKCLSFLI